MPKKMLFLLLFLVVIAGNVFIAGDSFSISNNISVGSIANLETSLCENAKGNDVICRTIKSNSENVLSVFCEGEYTYNGLDQKDDIKVYYYLDSKIYLLPSEFIIKKDGSEKEFKNAGLYELEVIKVVGGCTFDSISVTMNKKILDTENEVDFLDKIVKYDGFTHSLVLTGISEELVRIEYGMNTFRYASDIPYEVTARLVLIDVLNYTLTKDVFTAHLTILKGDVNMSGVTFNNKSAYYTGESITCEIDGTLPSDVSVAYEYYCNGERLYNMPVNVGKYTVIAKYYLHSADYYNYNPIPEMTAELEILPAIVDCSDIVFKNSEVKYDNNLHFIYASNIPSGVVATYTYADTGLVFNGVKNVGSYKIKLQLKSSSNDYSVNNFSEMIAILNIIPADIDMSGIAFNNISYVYDGKVHSPELIGTIPANVKVSLVVDEDPDVGEHLAYAHFESLDTNFANPKSMACKVTIMPRPITVSFKNHYLSGINKYIEFAFDGIIASDIIKVSLTYTKYKVKNNWYISTLLSLVDSPNYIIEEKHKANIFDITTTSEIFNEITATIVNDISRVNNTLKISEGKTLEINSAMKISGIKMTDYEVVVSSDGNFTGRIYLNESDLKISTRHLQVYALINGEFAVIDYELKEGCLQTSLIDTTNIILVMLDNNSARNIVILIVYLILALATMSVVTVFTIKYFRSKK